MKNDQSRRATPATGTYRVGRGTLARDAGAEGERGSGGRAWRKPKTPTLSQKARPGRGTQRTLVFDEIDTGIGGRAAEAVGKKLKSLARSNQVLCVTHLPQIATFGDHHYVVEKKKEDKKESGGRARTSIRAVTGEERTEEVARMLSGAKLTETSRKHAEQMIKANA